MSDTTHLIDQLRNRSSDSLGGEAQRRMQGLSQNADAISISDVELSPDEADITHKVLQISHSAADAREEFMELAKDKFGLAA